MTNYFQNILADLNRTLPEFPYALPPPYGEEDSNEVKVQTLLRQMRRAKNLNNRKELLLALWYIGQLVEVYTTTDRARCVSLLTPYYQKVALRIYYLFEHLGVEQIMRIQTMTITMVARMSHADYVRLLEEAVTIAGARF